MAHRGRLYPVHFRRDFNHNADIRSTTTLAATYVTTLKSGLVPPTIVDGHTFRLQDIAGPDDATVAWLSPLQHIGLWDWQCRLWVRIVRTVDVLLEATWFLERDGILASSWRGVAADRFDPLASGNPLTWRVLFTNTAIFPIPPNFNYSVKSAEGYPP
jgi:hypothetical protein